jgi:Rieske Fe-S protein
VDLHTQYTGLSNTLSGNHIFRKSGFMKLNFSKDSRDMPNSTCTLVGATALVSAGGSLSAFAATQSKGNPPAVFAYAKAPATGKARESEGDTGRSSAVLYKVAPEKIPAEMKGDTVEGVMAYSAMCAHLGCTLSNWDAPTKAFMCPSHDALFDPLQLGANTGGATSRTLPYFPVKAVDGKLVVFSLPSGYVGVKRTNLQPGSNTKHKL